ncbi:MAG: tRNA (adenosine(37)-N6)-threonylcarbamoyltransferase complex dimerization subunit type 1 TsaB [Omnitrophica bacterium GWA2_41_15]|nr:MAG: tRNA (adenosine(37)-N6)-threonylcarbamoyltransferase complex dimerization subunit type 1 TsaB [Omnitrophica bacterium GWA2_41_15]HAZ10258.1 tRNA (adenosine(37)-N6)-threonylcarbamoyltransferase complex dimerization subunit type 1 TsaB [Candidatus Omnitrophota bacterium]
MKILGIDTSSKFLNIALSEDEDIIKEESYLLDRRHASQLVPKVKELLKKYRTPISKIDVFIIGLGPGSFTGLRIGVSAIKGFGIASGKPCIGVASIDSIACNAQENNKDIIPIIDAKRGQVYAAIYRRKGNKVARLSDYLILPIEKLLKKVKGDSVFLGDGVPLYRNNISSINKKAVFLEEEYWYPGAGNLIKLGFSKKAKKINLAKLIPLYLYPENCQIRKP